MKVAINTKPYKGPWGGGNRFVHSLCDELERRNHQVTFALDPDVDIILIVDVRLRHPQVTFLPAQVYSHLRRRPGAIVVQRINECDERKGTHLMNYRLRIANYCADHTVFIASWLRDLTVWRRETGSSVILNGADDDVFRRDSARHWDGREPLRIVTHHWGAHANKGWDVYRKLDALAGDANWGARIRFTYIGSPLAGEHLRHTRLIPPLDGQALASAIAENHVYLTASVCEPAGMHHIEGAMVGLPLIYRNSGALPEYNAGFGEMFDGPDDLAGALERMFVSYPWWKRAMAGYPHTARRMAAAYVDLFEQLHRDRERISKSRRLWRNPISRLLTYIPL